MRKRFYILFVARDAEGQLRKIPIPIHYLYVFMAGALIGMFTITGMAGSYTRMLWKVASFNQLRSEKNSLQTRYKQLEQVNHEKDIQVASLGSLANEVSMIYGLKPNAKLLNDGSAMKPDRSLRPWTSFMPCAVRRLPARRRQVWAWAYSRSHPDRLGHATTAPTLWPVMGPITGSFRRAHRPVQR